MESRLESLAKMYETKRNEQAKKGDNADKADEDKD
jgi:hypothetical protein